jgi:transcription initiation factor TFIID subunit 2
VKQPVGGLRFVAPFEGLFKDRPVHMYTHGDIGEASLWFPCVEQWHQRCSWTLAYTVDATFVAVSSGELREQSRLPDGRKMFQYLLETRTPASHIGLAVGSFEVYPDPVVDGVTHFCLPGLMAQLQYSVLGYPHALKVYEEVLRFEFPYKSHNLVFVDEGYSPLGSFASMSLMSQNILHSARIIDQTVPTRETIARCLAQQFFLHYVTFRSKEDIWLILGLAEFLVGEFIRKTLGENELRFFVHNLMIKVCEQDKNQPPLRTDSFCHVREHFSDFMRTKSCVVMRMLQGRIGHASMLEVLNQLCVLSSGLDNLPPAIKVAVSNALGSDSYLEPALVSTAQLFALVGSVCNQDLGSFRTNWIERNGAATFNVSYQYSESRNMLEINIMQPDENSFFQGDLRVGVQETDSHYDHIIKIDQTHISCELPVHSKNKLTKRKKTRLEIGEEVDVDLSFVTTKSPVMWVRIDQDSQWLRTIRMDQPQWAWSYQLRYERHVGAQYEAAERLSTHHDKDSREVLVQMATKDCCFFRVRIRALQSLAECPGGEDALLAFFRETFFVRLGASAIVRSNNFSDISEYHV